VPFDIDPDLLLELIPDGLNFLEFLISLSA